MHDDGNGNGGTAMTRQESAMIDVIGAGGGTAMMGGKRPDGNTAWLSQHPAKAVAHFSRSISLMKSAEKGSISPITLEAKLA